MSNEALILYYIGLLIMQYSGATNNQTLTFSSIPASGNFTFRYGTLTSPNVAWNASNSTIQSILTAFTGISGITVTGGLNTGVLTIVLGNSPSLILGTNVGTLEDASSNPITSQTSGSLVKAAGTIQALVRLQVMDQLPLTVQNAFNLIPTIQTVTFSAPPSSGAFEITLSVTSTPTATNVTTASILYSDTDQQIQNAINAILPSGQCTVNSNGGLSTTGEITLTFSGCNPNIISITANTTGETTEITTNLAFGSQLDVIGKYVGVTRNGNTPQGPVTLDDADFYTLIQLAIIRNNFGSSMSQITQLLWSFFGGQITAYDYQNMQMSYVVNTTGLSLNLIYTMISQNLLPKPMGVQLANVIAADNTSFFSFRTYLIPTPNPGFNTYTSYSLTSPWVTYNDAIGI